MTWVLFVVVINQKLSFSSNCQQGSFGRKRVERCWVVWGQRELANFAERECVGGQNSPPVVLPVLQGKGLERKEASRLIAFLVTFVATKVTRPSRGHERDDDIVYGYIMLEPQLAALYSWGLLRASQ